MDGSRYGQKWRESSVKFYPHDFEIFDIYYITKFETTGFIVKISKEYPPI